MNESDPDCRGQMLHDLEGWRLDELLETFRGYLLTVAQKELPANLQAGCGASDLVQETFLAAHAHSGQFRGSTEAELRGWLRQILRNKLVTLRRRGGRGPAALPAALSGVHGSSSADWTAGLVASDPSPSEVLTSAEQVQSVHAALGRLPEKYRQPLLWHLQDHVSLAEIGGRLGISEDAAGKRFRRAVQKVRQFMETPS